MKTIHVTVERTERIGYEKEVTEAEYEAISRHGILPFDPYEVAGFDTGDHAEYDYAVDDSTGNAIVPWY